MSGDELAAVLTESNPIDPALLLRSSKQLLPSEEVPDLNFALLSSPPFCTRRSQAIAGGMELNRVDATCMTAQVVRYLPCDRIPDTNPPKPGTFVLIVAHGRGQALSVGAEGKLPKRQAGTARCLTRFLP